MSNPPKQHLRPWRAVAEQFNLRTGEHICRSRAEQIGRKALAKMRRALERMGMGEQSGGMMGRIE